LRDADGTTLREITMGGAASEPVLAPWRDGLLVSPKAGLLIALDASFERRWELRHGGRIAAMTSDAHAIYVAGQFLGRIEWGGHHGETADRYGDPFVGAVSMDGEQAWLVTGKGKGVAYASDVAVAGGRVWVTGAFDEALSFPGTPPLPAQGSGIQSGFVVTIAPPPSGRAGTHPPSGSPIRP
jgi:hypothetical protein